MADSGWFSEVSDFKEVLSTPLDGQLPLLVGGHAVNLWAIVYRERVGRELDQWLPLNSKDLDLVGTTDLLDAMKKKFGGDVRFAGPRSPMVGQLIANLQLLPFFKPNSQTWPSWTKRTGTISNM